MTAMQTAMPAEEDAFSMRFRTGLAGMMAAGPAFAVLDGAHFDDLQQELLNLDIPARSLFLSGGDPKWRRDGPWLVSLVNRHICDQVADFALEKPCAVFWSCPAGEAALYKHLRTLNRILVPDDRIAGNDGRSGKKVVYERVLFRHWDPNVMGSLLHSFTKSQFARILGPATTIFMNATDYGGMKRVTKSNNLPPMPKGPLAITPSEISATNDLMAQASKRRICNYLRDVAPSQTAAMSDAELSAVTQGYMNEGRTYGVQSEAALARWSYMQVVTSGKLTTNPDVVKVMTAHDPAVSPDRRVQLLLQASINYARENR